MRLLPVGITLLSLALAPASVYAELIWEREVVDASPMGGRRACRPRQ